MAAVAAGDPAAKVEAQEVARQVDARPMTAYDRTADDAVRAAAPARAGGKPLAPGVRHAMESRLGHSFAHVRVHADGHAAASARELGANAYAVGDDIVFGAGRLSSGTPAGRALLAHELAHVVQ